MLRYDHSSKAWSEKNIMNESFKTFSLSFPTEKKNFLVMSVTASLTVTVLSLHSKRPKETMLLNTKFYKCYTVKAH